MGKVIRCNSTLMQAKEKVNKVVFIPLPRAKESPPPDTVTLTTPKDKDIFEVSSELCSMIQEETVPLSRLTSEIPINTKNKLNISWLLRELTQDSTFSVEEKLQSQLETFCLSTKSQKVPPSATLSHQSGIKENTQDAQAPMPPLSDTLMMD